MTARFWPARAATIARAAADPVALPLDIPPPSQARSLTPCVVVDFDQV